MLGNVVLPPLGPLFAGAHLRQSSVSPSSSPPAAATTGNDTPLRTPTSVHAFLNGAFPSSSPVKKDAGDNAASTAAATTPPKKRDGATKSHVPTANALLLALDATAVDDDGSASPTCEDEKLRLSRERNRLHAQRTRIRKRELLESLKERIHALQREHGLLKQAFEFHATAVSLLTLGSGACDDPSIKHLEDVSDAALELFESTSTLHHAFLDDDDDDALLLDECADGGAGGAGRAHEPSCELYDDDGNDSDHADSAACSCACAAGATDPGEHLNSNGKRLHAPLVGSKEEREQLRRERNRLHARRARLRKKLVLERSQQAVHELRKRNEYLRERLAMLITSIYGASAAATAAATGSCPP
ncbi:hypothetical protein PybrP1_006630 [[Pythium] brassicae (nom. inval.)]|nr:hypothetical protein PybrP1_006630 [[Pythium] brassicae (nom. inval.)]